MSIELMILAGVSVAIGLVMYFGGSESGARTPAQEADRRGWLVGSLAAVGIGVWQPWFSSSWWKAIIFAHLLSIGMAVLSNVLLGPLLIAEKIEGSRVISRLITLVIIFGVAALSYRACRG